TDLGHATTVGTTFSVPVLLTGPGTHKLRVQAIDTAGNFSDYSFLELFIDDTAPVVTDVLDVTPDPRVTPVDAVDVTFSEWVNLATSDWHALTLTRDGGPNLITDAVTVTRLTDTTFRVGNLMALTELAGTHVLSVRGAGVEDRAGNAGTGVASDTWFNGAN